MADGEANGDTKRARPLHRWRIARGANREGRNGHQVIGAEAMEKAQDEG